MYQIVSTRGFRTSRNNESSAREYARKHAEQWREQGFSGIRVTVWYYGSLVAEYVS